jgi:hypothetical protein
VVCLLRYSHIKGATNKQPDRSPAAQITNAGDDLSVRLELRAGARATLRAAGASLAQGGAAALSIRADLAERADLIADPGALILCQGSRVDVRLELALGAGAAVDWRELIVLGRTGEPPGQATLRWDVTRLGRPVLRQFVDLAGPARAGLTAGRRVLACALISGPGLAPRTVAASPVAVAQRVDEHTLLVTVLDDDDRATRQLEDLCHRAGVIRRRSGWRGTCPSEPIDDIWAKIPSPVTTIEDNR